MTMIDPRPGRTETAYLEAAEARWGVPEPSDGPVFCGDCRLGRMDVLPTESMSNADASDPRIADALALLDTWPEARDGLGAFINEFWALEQADVAPASRGSCSGHEIVGSSRCAYVTIYDAFGCFDGLLHEWGHLRLRAVGVDLETHDGRLFSHADEERFPSPIRRDKLRPMSAVLHGVYCWTLFAEGDIRLAEAGHADVVTPTLKWNLPKIEEGEITLAGCRWAGDGEGFGSVLLEWMRDVVERGWEVVGREYREAAIEANAKWVREQPAWASPLHGWEMTEEMPR